jgi:large subunit ribosomal protein L15
MALNLHQLKSYPKRKPGKRVGRGHGSGKGTYAGRGLKGQRARSGGRRGLNQLGIKHFLRQIPKVKGFKSFYPKFNVVNLDQLSRLFNEGETVNPDKILAKRLVDQIYPGIKILGRGKIDSAQAFSKSARDAIIKKGGAAEVIKQ